MNEEPSETKEPARDRGRGVRMCISISGEQYENARKMVDLGLIKSLSSLWDDGYRERMAKISPEFCKLEAKRLNDRADALEKFYRELDGELDAR